MKVKQLIEALQTCDPEAEVLTQNEHDVLSAYVSVFSGEFYTDGDEFNEVEEDNDDEDTRNCVVVYAGDARGGEWDDE